MRNIYFGGIFQRFALKLLQCETYWETLENFNFLPKISLFCSGCGKNKNGYIHNSYNMVPGAKPVEARKKFNKFTKKSEL